MAKLPGIFDIFDNLEQIKVEDIAKWLKHQVDFTHLENFLAQRILYPQTVPMTEVDMNIDLAILREALRLCGPMLGDNPFLNVTLRKILIPSTFLNFIPNLQTLTWAFVDGLLYDRKKSDFFEDLWTVILTGQIDEAIGSVILPQFQSGNGILKLNVVGKEYQIRAGTVIVIPCPNKRCEVTFKVNAGKILGKDDLSVEVYGGKLGLMIDGRR